MQLPLPPTPTKLGPACASASSCLLADATSDMHEHHVDLKPHITASCKWLVARLYGSQWLRLQVVELALQMTPAMTAIYDAIADIMDSCIKELRRSNKIDTTELTIEHGLFKSFDEHVRRQLEAVWHTVSPRTKQVIKSPICCRSSSPWAHCFNSCGDACLVFPRPAMMCM